MSKQSSWVVNVAEGEFEQAVLQRSHEVPVVVDFWAPWCGPCQMLGPLLERLIDERGGAVVLAKVNTDEAPELARRYGISSIPAVIAFRGGRPVLDFIGALPEPQLRDFLDQVGPRRPSRPCNRQPRWKQPVRTKPRNSIAERSSWSATTRLPCLAWPGCCSPAVRTTRRPNCWNRSGQAGEWRRGRTAERYDFPRQHAQPLGDEAAARRRLEKEPANAQVRYELGYIVAAAGRYPEALELLLAAAERDPEAGRVPGGEVMVKIFQVIGMSQSAGGRVSQQAVGAPLSDCRL